MIEVCDKTLELIERGWQMTDLTEKMKNKTLEDKRLYYCLFDNPKDYVAVYYGHYINDFHFDTYRRNNSVKIIGEVPTYEELQALKEENARLKELLKECLAHLSLGEIGTSVTPLNILLTRINATLGESEEQ